MTFRHLTLIVCAILVFAASAKAQDPEQMPFFSRSDVREAITRALNSVHRIKCGQEPCAKATTEEFAEPPIDLRDARAALMTGAASARLQWCGVDWRDRTFPLMMMDFQQRGIHDGRVLGMLRLIHNARYSKDHTNLQALRTCSDEVKARLEQTYPKVDLPPWQGAVNNALLDREVAHMVQRVLGEIHKSRCGEKLCKPATEAEKADPPVSIAQARQAMKIGAMSAVAAFCGLDWQNRIYLPFIAHNRHELKLEQRELVIVSMLHGTMHGFILQNYQQHERACSEKMRENLEKRFSNG